VKCPNCGKKTNIHRSHRKETRERVISYLTFTRPYRCHTCMSRFWRPTLFPYRRGHRKKIRKP
jgi:uncharacterized protein with PIN domain